MSGMRNVGYYVNWAIYGRNHQPQDIPYDKLTHVLYSFANVRETGEVYLSDTWSDLEKHYPTDSWNDVGTNVYGCVKQLYILKKKNRNMKVLLSIGGWTYSKNFPGPASTQSGRETFASTAVKLVEDLGFDGLDVDWEYPANEAEGRHFVELMAQTRRALDALEQKSKCGHMQLTIACPAGPNNWKHLQLRELTPLLDSYHLMAYDYAGSWDSTTGHQANLHPNHSNPQITPFSTTAAVDHYLSHGVPPQKLVIGMPLYGRAFTNTHGLGQSFSGVGEGSWENGVWDFKDLPRPGATENTDKDIGASWCQDTNSKTVVSYDNKAIAQQKVQYIQHRRLGGAMFWETSGDRKGADGLIPTVYDALAASGIDNSQNELNFPGSKYENLRNGMPNE